MKTKSTLLSLFTLIASSFLSLSSFSQGTLQFNQVMIMANSPVTVPVGKVWKITSIYGIDRVCVPCVLNEHLTSTACNGRYVDYVGASFLVNNKLVFSERDWDPAYHTYATVWTDNLCTSQYSTYTSYGWGYYDITPNYNIFPMWLPAGTVVQTSSANIFLSVIEFNVIP